MGRSAPNPAPLRPSLEAVAAVGLLNPPGDGDAAPGELPQCAEASYALLPGSTLRSGARSPPLSRVLPPVRSAPYPSPSPDPTRAAPDCSPPIPSLRALWAGIGHPRAVGTQNRPHCAGRPADSPRAVCPPPSTHRQGESCRKYRGRCRPHVRSGEQPGADLGGIGGTRPGRMRQQHRFS